VQDFSGCLSWPVWDCSGGSYGKQASQLKGRATARGIPAKCQATEKPSLAEPTNFFPLTMQFQ
jgi:hypothetical protein